MKKQGLNRLKTDLLHLAGEYRVCSELMKRGIFATVTYGNRKSVDIYAISDTRHLAFRIEVKTSQLEKFVTGISQKGLADDPAAPQFWVLVQIKQVAANEFAEKFFVLTHKEICAAQAERNEKYATGYRVRHSTEPDYSKGVDQVKIEDVEQHQDRWDKICKKFVPKV